MTGSPDYPWRREPAEVGLRRRHGTNKPANYLGGARGFSKESVQSLSDFSLHSRNSHTQKKRLLSGVTALD